MNKLNQVTLFIFSCLFFIYSQSHAQTYEIGGGPGVTNYAGEVSRHPDPAFAKPAVNLFLRYNLNPEIVIKGAVMFGELYATDENSPFALPASRNYSFNSNINEFSLQMEYNFFNFRDPNNQKKRWSPYFTSGLAIMSSRQESFENNTSNRINFAIPFGAGIKYRLSPQWNLSGVFGARKTFTDFLDGLNENPPKGQKANPNTQDMYFYTGISVSYTIYTIHCPFR